MKLIDKLFTVSLSLISITSLIVTVTGLVGYPLPVWAGRVLGLVNLVSLPVLLYSTVQSLKEKLAAAKALANKGPSAAKGLKSGGKPEGVSAKAVSSAGKPGSAPAQAPRKKKKKKKK